MSCLSPTKSLSPFGSPSHSRPTVFVPAFPMWPIFAELCGSFQSTLQHRRCVLEIELANFQRGLQTVKEIEYCNQLPCDWGQHSPNVGDFLSFDDDGAEQHNETSTAWLDVGGSKFCVSRWTLTGAGRNADHMLYATFSGMFGTAPTEPEDGAVFLDRDGDSFSLGVLQWLRDSELSATEREEAMSRTLSVLSNWEVHAIHSEAIYFGLDDLQNLTHKLTHTVVFDVTHGIVKPNNGIDLHCFGPYPHQGVATGHAIEYPYSGEYFLRLPQDIVAGQEGFNIGLIDSERFYLLSSGNTSDGGNGRLFDYTDELINAYIGTRGVSSVWQGPRSRHLRCPVPIPADSIIGCHVQWCTDYVEAWFSCDGTIIDGTRETIHNSAEFTISPSTKLFPCFHGLATGARICSSNAAEVRLAAANLQTPESPREASFLSMSVEWQP